MTLQIVCRAVEDETVVELHGWLSGPEIVEFQRACATGRSRRRIDLQNVVGASPEGIVALKEQRARGAQLSGASPYIELLLGGPGTETRGSGQGIM